LFKKILHLFIRVARCYILLPKILIWICLGRPWNGKCSYILGLFVILMVCIYFGKYMGIYIWWSSGIFSPVLVFCTKKNLTTLLLIFPVSFSSARCNVFLGLLCAGWPDAFVKISPK
jgi:hypothetical protein